MAIKRAVRRRARLVSNEPGWRVVWRNQPRRPSGMGAAGFEPPSSRLWTRPAVKAPTNRAPTLAAGTSSL